MAMRLLAQYVAERIIGGLPTVGGSYDEKLVQLLAEERARLLATGIKVIVFLFTTITVIALTVFQSSDKESVSFLGLKIHDPYLFAFVAFMVGNVLYVVSTGLFLKVFIIGFMILDAVKRDKFAHDPALHGFVRSFHANVISYFIIFRMIPNNSRSINLLLQTINIYTKYYVIIAYGIYYYFVLAIYI